MSDARKIEVAVPVSDAAYLSFAGDLDSFGLRIGQWQVTLEGGNLVVRTWGSAINESPLFRVPA